MSKGLSFRSGCTGMAEGGYNAVLKLVDPEDSFEAHYKDTIKGGSYLNDPDLVNILTRESPERLHDLERVWSIVRQTGIRRAQSKAIRRTDL